MANVNNKEVREQCNVMNDAWNEGAKAVTFNGITQGNFNTDTKEENSVNGFGSRSDHYIATR